LLQSGEERVLMTSATESSQMTFGRWQIHPDAFEWIGEKLKDFENCKVFFCDEIGPLEVLEDKGWIKALDIVNQREEGVSVITFRPSLQAYFQQRYPDMTLYNLDTENDNDKAVIDIKYFFGID
jgi:nucleoside-triphosphatase THEP1